MEEQNQFQSDNPQTSSDDYNPDQIYNYERAHTEPEIGPNNHPIPPTKKKPNSLASAALAASLATIFLCCCNPYASILSSVMSITLAICSRYFNNDKRRMYPQAVIAIVLSTLFLILILGSIAINYLIVPYLYESSPEFKEYYDTLYKLLNDAITQGIQQ